MYHEEVDGCWKQEASWRVEGSLDLSAAKDDSVLLAIEAPEPCIQVMIAAQAAPGAPVEVVHGSSALAPIRKLFTDAQVLRIRGESVDAAAPANAAAPPVSRPAATPLGPEVRLLLQSTLRTFNQAIGRRSKIHEFGDDAALSEPTRIRLLEAMLNIGKGSIVMDPIVARACGIQQ